MGQHIQQIVSPNQTNFAKSVKKYYYEKRD